jgi:DNA-binding LacI/PurR family transcriptional regulator
LKEAVFPQTHHGLARREPLTGYERRHHSPGAFYLRFSVSPAPKKKSSPVLRSTADFARYVGLARTTVSRVLNGQPGLKQKTIDHVMRAVAETGFTPNAHALHLKGKRTATIGICTENLLTPPAVNKLAALQRLLRDRRFSSLIEVLEPGTGREVVRHFLSLRVEAVVFIGHFHAEELEARIAELATHGTPHVLIDQYGIKNANTVALDRASGMQAAINHLYELGHRSFGLLGVEQAPVSRIDRVTGIRGALRSHGLDYAACTVSLDHLHARRGDFDYGRKLGGSFMELAQRPTAFIALNDEIAVGAMRAFGDAGLKLPRDASVVGFNNQDLCEMIIPTLTSVDQSIVATIATSADVIFTQLAATSPRTKPIIRTIPPQLVVRGSTGPAPARNL